jgi:hypothetical protein
MVAAMAKKRMMPPNPYLLLVDEEEVGCRLVVMPIVVHMFLVVLAAKFMHEQHVVIEKNTIR